MGIATYSYNRSTSGGEIIRELVNASDGQGLHFDGASGYIDIAPPLDLGTKFSYELIVQADAIKEFAFIDFYGGGRLWFGRNGSTGKVAFYDTDYRDFSVGVLDDLKVHHLVATVDGTAATLYDNGNQVSTVTLGRVPDVDVCTNAIFPNAAFAGTFYRARFWNKTLSSTEVTASYENATVPFADQYGNATVLNTGSVPAGLRWRIIEHNTVNFVTYGAANNSIGTEFVTTTAIPALNANDRLQQIGCMADYDLAFANPTQSNHIQDRAGNVDGTKKPDAAGGVTQVTPIEQLNSKAIAVGTAAVTPADAQVHIKGADGAYGFIHEDATGVKTATYSNGSTGFIGTQSSHPLSLMVAGSGKLTIDYPAGQVNISDATNRALGPAGASNLQISGTGAMQLGMLRSEASAGGPHINLTKSRGAAPGTFAIVQDGDSLGKLSFGADDGADYASLGAYIEGKVAGTPGANDMPGSLVLATTADGATDPTPRLTINSAGTVSTSSTAAETLSINSSAGQGSFQAWKNSTTSVFLIGNRNAVSGTQATNGDGTDLWATTGRGIAFYTNDSTAARLNISSAGAVTMPSTPAFSATPSAAQDNLAVAPAVVDIVLGTEIFDQGANFASNTFTAPVAGRYQLNAILGLVYIDSAADFYQIQIATSNRTYTYTFDPDFGQDAVYWEFGPSVLADMDASDTAVMRFFQSGGTAQTDVATVRTFFNGYLAC